MVVLSDFALALQNLEGRVQEYLGALEHDDQIHCSTMEWVHVDEWYNGRVCSSAMLRTLD